MQIVCPECKFSREVDENRIPARSQVATCPKCQTKFKFRDLPEQDFIIEESVAQEPAPKQKPKPEARPKLEPKPEPAADPVLKPFTQKAPVRVEPEKPVFPGIPEPDADAKGGLWERLHDMTPPESIQAPEKTAPAEPPHHAETPPASQPDQEPIPGWTGEFNDSFPDPMGLDTETEDEDEPADNDYGMQVPPPFEQLDRYGFFNGLFLTVKLILFSPRLFFSVMPVGNGVAKPLTFAILVALIQTLAQFAWGIAGLTPGMEVTSGGLIPMDYNVTNGLFEMLLTPAFAAITLYVVTGFYHIILVILRAESQGFEGSFRALAYSYAPLITGIIPMPTVELVAGWMLFYAIWSLVLTAIGFKHIHRTSYLKTVPALLMPLLIGMILALLAVQGQLPTI